MTDTRAPALRPPSGADTPALQSTDDLARLEPAFVRTLGDEFDLAALVGRLCPVLLDGDRTAVFALADYVSGDQVDELERMMRARGYAPASVPRYVLPASLILAVARRQLTAESLRGQRVAGPSSQRCALASLFVEIVRWGVEQGASDVHLNVGTPQADADIRYTINGAYVAPGCFRGISGATLLDVLAVAWMDVRGGNGAVFDPLAEQQGRIPLDIAGRPIVVRWASLAADTGPSVCLRILRLDAAEGGSSLAELGYLPSQVQALERARSRAGGAIVLAGIVGSGKSTSIATLMRGIAPTRKVITLEDPVEYRIGNALQNTVGRPLDAGAPSVFDAKLRTIKRSAMNDLLIGEVRDSETGRAFMDLAGSGINVYTTTHTGSAVMIPERLASDFIGVSRDFLATPGVLKLLVYQALLPRLCAQCALPFRRLPAAPAGLCWCAWAREFACAYQVDPDALRARNPAGCADCVRPQLPQLNGTCGRTVVAEMIEPGEDDVFLDLVRRRDNLALRRHVDAMPRTASCDSDMTGKRAADCALYKAAQGLIDPRVIATHFDSPHDATRAALMRAGAGVCHG